MGDAVQKSGEGVGRRGAVLLAAAGVFVVLDTWIRMMLPASRPLPGWLGVLLVLLGLFASLGWLFVGKPARDRDAVTISYPPASEAVMLLEIITRGINRLRVAEGTKDAMVRWLAALVIGAMLLGWDIYLTRSMHG